VQEVQEAVDPFAHACHACTCTPKAHNSSLPRICSLHASRARFRGRVNAGTVAAPQPPRAAWAAKGRNCGMQEAYRARVAGLQMRDADLLLTPKDGSHKVNL